MQKTVESFLNSYLDCKRPLLLGLSGGPDSLALFHLLLNYKKERPFELGVAHVNHKWREESDQEADFIQSLAISNNIKFHLKTLSPESLAGNLELACREERLGFFEQLCKEAGYQAVLLGHHADDHSETILKRVLEGASLPSLSGLAVVSQIRGLHIWRPLLTASKKEIYQWLEKNGCQGFEDSTNRDPKYLRARFRTRIFPMLRSEFGKELSDPLRAIGNEAAELKEFLDSLAEPWLQKTQEGGLGSLLDLSGFPIEQHYLLKYAIKLFCRKEGILLSKQQLASAAGMVNAKAADKMLSAAGKKLYLDRGCLFILKNELAKPSGFAPLLPGIWEYSGWRFHVQAVETQHMPPTDWTSLWNEGASAVIPFGEYRIGPPDNAIPYPGNEAALSKFWSNNKVPAFFREAVPVIWKQNRIQHEFLTGRLKENAYMKNDQCFKVNMHRG